MDRITTEVVEPKRGSMQFQDRLKSILGRPNTLTLFRIVAVPLIIALMCIPNRFTCFLAAIIFSAAAITDYFDGHLARRKGMVSDFGKVMDPLADKLLVSSALIMLSAVHWVPAWAVCVIIGRELAVTGLRNIMAQNERDLSASWLGKYKTGFQIAAIIPLLLHYRWLTIDMHAIGTFFFWAAMIFTIWSGIDYFVRCRGLLKI
jgi:CDP-diacylglycerol--glycerol-3-phosphate 3-phosphatidyltransferase